MDQEFMNCDLKEWELERFLTKLAVIEQQFDFIDRYWRGFLKMY